MRGLSEAYGSWKMICIARRCARIALVDEREEVARRRTRPCPTSARAAAARSRPVVDLPQPDSPTSASVSPAPSVEARRRRPRAPRRRAAEQAAAHREVLDQVLDAQQRRSCRRQRARRAARASTRRRARRRCRRSGGSSRAAALDRRTGSADGSGSRATGVSGFGTWPSIAARRSCSRCSCGIEPSSPIVYGCCGSANSVADRRALDDAPGVHHRDVVGDLGDHAEVVRDEDDRGAGLLAQRAHQLEDLRLDGDVERGGRLVGDQQLRPAGERHRDHHALAHAAREPVRIVVEAPLGRRDAHAAQHLDRAARFACVAADRRDGAGCTSAIWSPMVNAGLSEVIGSWKIIAMRSPRSSRIAPAASFSRSHALEQDLAAGDAAGRLRHQAHDRQRGDALAAARLADDAERAAALRARSSRRRPRGTRRPRSRTRCAGRARRAARSSRSGASRARRGTARSRSSITARSVMPGGPRACSAGRRRTAGSARGSCRRGGAARRAARRGRRRAGRGTDSPRSCRSSSAAACLPRLSPPAASPASSAASSRSANGRSRAALVTRPRCRRAPAGPRACCRRPKSRRPRRARTSRCRRLPVCAAMRPRASITCSWRWSRPSSARGQRRARPRRRTRRCAQQLEARARRRCGLTSACVASAPTPLARVRAQRADGEEAARDGDAERAARDRARRSTRSCLPRTRCAS